VSAAEVPWTLRYDPRVPRRLAKVNDRAVLRRLEVAARRLEKQPRLGEVLKGYHEVRLYRVGTPGGEHHRQRAAGYSGCAQGDGEIQAKEGFVRGRK